jgi:serine protease Do
MRNVDLFDEYLADRLNGSDKNDFEQRLKNDPEFATEFGTHKFFIESIEYSLRKDDLLAKMNVVHEASFGAPNVVGLKAAKVNYWKIAAVAASVSLLIFTGGAVIFQNIYFGKRVESDIPVSKTNPKTSHTSKKTKREYSAPNIEATGFAISSKGYFLTSLHAVKNADSVMIENDDLDFVPAERVWEDTKLDVAIFKLKNAADLKMKDVPISFRNSDLDLGEKVFALGYPRETVVYTEGNVTASSGLQGDTTKYQLSMLVNPGNSGSPVLDEQGNLVAIIAGRNNNAQGVSYAVKAEYIFQMIKNIPDSKLKKEILINGRNNIKKLKRTEQVKKIKPFVYNIMVYKSQADN